LQLSFSGKTIGMRPPPASLRTPSTSPTLDVLRTEQHDGTFAIVPTGTLDERCVEQIRTVLAAAVGPEPVPVVIDLGDCVLHQRSPLLKLMEVVGRTSLSGVPVALSCRRLTGRQLLHRIRPPSVPVFSSIGDAVQLHRYAELGYAPGWKGAAARESRDVA
jgi:hypothetical protein